ncbi:asparaginase-domain-containing protein [Meira miltonrushii]|uniref:asparaginase n=1 Tax=Meira miltonrushii TaxID=1280837 RepID=A0A316VRX9_9BASI|nr:asparaginase-domain-containing protein [Meira miltonrushii]PWN38255.1 asparaginase-domain-containing protein [Meira miltonrushii]
MNESRILILYCGGTLGMVRHPSQGYVPYPGFLTETLRSQSRFHDPEGNSIFSWSDTTERYQKLEMILPTMITPMAEKKRIRFAVLEYDPLLDSSNIETKDWLRLAADIDLNYQSFDAFVILHGTDTMSYTSSALSMLLENLGKPVVVTGAQVPLSELRNDAIENILGALILAASHPIPEVTLFFSSTLYRGNRVSKLSNSTLDAFDSPNLAPLATAGISIQVNRQLVLKPRELQKFRVHDRMSQQVVLLRLFPGLQVETIANFFASPIQGVILHSFGAGNAPNKPELLEIFRKATFERDIVIVNISQCIRGEVSAIYQVGKQLQSVGVVAGGDMTPECALTKLSYLLAKPELTRDQIRTLMGKSLRGELTERHKDLTDENDAGRSLTPGAASSEGGQVRRLFQYILTQQGEASISVDEDIDDLAIAAERSFLPFLIQQACLRGDNQALERHLNRQHQLDAFPLLISNAPDGSSNTNTNSTATHSSSLPTFSLHIAAALGHTDQVRQLLEAGHLVHARDYTGHTPLFLALQNGHQSTVEILKLAGAHLASHEKDTTE